MRAYEGYYENGRFDPKGQPIRSKGRHRAVLTVLDNALPDTEERLHEFDRVTEIIRSGAASTDKPEKFAGSFTYALSADITAHFIKGSEKISEFIRGLIAQGHAFVIPPTVFFEIRRGFIKRPSPENEGTFDCICRLFPIGELSITAWEYAARIYADSRTAGYPIFDILTAAFCLAGGYKLVTSKAGRFEGIEGLSVIYWSDV